MPCDARVVVKATVQIENVDRFVQTLRGKDINVYDAGDRYTMRFGYDVTVEISKAGSAVLRSNALTWDEGVDQLNQVMNWLGQNGVVFNDVSQPETHKHDHPGPWQKQGVR